MEEVWKDIKGYEGLYQISNHGKIKSLVRWKGNKYEQRIKILANCLDSRGYIHANLSKNKVVTSHLVHRLVGIHFIENKHNKPQINHKDGNKLNNLFYNLEWVTGSENMIHAYATGIRTINKTKKRVLMLSKQNEFIMCFDSLNSAYKETGIYKTGILLCCRGIRHTAGGYKWQFITKER